MYPRKHALISIVVVSIAALIAGITVYEAFLWVVIGAVVGVFIDGDHLVLAALIGGKREESVYWMSHPIKALQDPGDLVEDIRYGGRDLHVHRMVSHLFFLGLLVLLQEVHALFLPAAISLAAHIVTDFGWDIYHGNYTKGT